jgi:hypothetical protein
MGQVAPVKANQLNSTIRKGRLIGSGQSIGPAEQIIEGIQDDEIKAFERVALANSLLGVRTAHFSIIEKHKNGMTAMMR